MVIEQRIAPDLLLSAGKGLGRFAYSNEKLNSIADALWKAPSYVNQAEAMTYLHIGHNMIEKLIAAGLLATIAPPSATRGHPNAIWFDRAALSNFASTQVTTTELAENMGAEPWGLLRRLRTTTAVPTLDRRSPTNCYWRRADMVSLVASIATDVSPILPLDHAA